MYKERVVTLGLQRCRFWEEARCKVGGLAWLTWVLGKLPGYRGGDHVVYGDSGYLEGGETGCGEG